MGGAALAIAVILVLRPMSMAQDAGKQATQQLTLNARALVYGLNDHFSSGLVPPGDPATASGDEIARWLAREPLLVAVMRRSQGQAWIREGSRLVPGAEGPRLATLRALGREAERAGRETGTEPFDSEGGLGCSVSQDWICFWEWRPGTEAMKAFLRQTQLGPDSDYRATFQLRPVKTVPRLLETGGPMEMNALDQAKTKVSAVPSFLPNQWVLWIIAKPEADLRALSAYYRGLTWGWIQSISIAGAVGAGLWFHRTQKRRDALDADRLATMTHSLKTPLAVLKLRCDTLRLGRASEADARHELSQMGLEVDRLTGIIERTLRCFRVQEPQETVPPGWFQHISDELQPAFLAESRMLHVRLTEASARAAHPELRIALLTLLENALMHGRSDVQLETRRIGHQFQIRVSDEGPGLDADVMQRLGRPFQRVRESGQEGFEQEGNGLGLHLLVQSAQQEGWGLEMESEAGRGVQVTLRIQAEKGGQEHGAHPDC
jgi:signal transduction histidine kinase